MEKGPKTEEGVRSSGPEGLQSVEEARLTMEDI